LYIVFTYNTPYSLIGLDQATYSLDQFVADIWDVYEPPGQFGLPASPHPYYAANQAEGNAYTPFVSLATFRSQNSALIYSVWRLDAATPALAQGLVDKAMAAESAGLTGQVCIDETTNPPAYDYGLGGPEWELRMAANFAREAGFNVTEDQNSAEFGTAPAPSRCDNAVLYSGWYSFNNYNNAFTWNTGAIGYHIDSASAVNPRGGSNWSANALLNGITATHGSVSEPYVQGFAHSDGVFNNLFQGANLGDAFLRNTSYLKWMMLNIGDPLYRPFPAGFPAVTAPSNSLALNPQYLIGGTPSMGTITLAAAAASDTAFTLKSGQTGAATVPATITVPAGQITASFPISTSFVASDTPLFITAASPGLTLTNTLVPQPVLAALFVSPGTVTAGASAMGTVYLNENAPAGGIVVSLATNNGAVSVPPSVTVPPGSSIVSFPIATSAVAATTSVSIGASCFGALTTATLTVNVAPVPPVISGVAVGSITPSGATITWTTDQASNSQVAYGTTSGYGSLSALNAASTTSHSVTLTGLTASTTYYYQVQSRSSQGLLANSGGYTFSTAGIPIGQPLLQLQGNQTEVSGVTNKSVVTPSIAPAGFTGAVVVNGTGSVNYTLAQTGDGVYFLNCCVNGNNAYYKFTGSTVGNIFNTSQGQITFYLKSRYSFAQRTANAATSRYAFDVRDGNGTHLFYFLTQVSGGLLFFNYGIAGTAQYAYLQAGTEDTTFGNGVIMQVQMTWNAGVTNLYLNGVLVKSAPYSAPATNWSAASVFDLGAYEYQTYGGFYGSDDVINGFTVTGRAAGPDTTPPVVTMTAPANGSFVNGGAVTVTATATDNVAVSTVQFKVDGANLGGPATGAGPSYSVSWNTAGLATGPHTLSAVASDAAGNTAASSISVTMDTTPPTVSVTAPASGATVGGTVAVSANATDSAGITGVQFQVDGANLGGVIAGAPYSVSWNTVGVANGLHTLSATASDTAGNTATSSVSITVNNAIAGPVISGVITGTVTYSGATITWTTDQVSSSQVAYGTTSSYGSLSALNSALTTSHSVTLTGLAASTTYYYQAQSQNAQGGLATLGGFTFVTAAAPVGPQPLLQIQGNQTEVSGVTNKSVVTPSVAPAGFTGAVVVNGTGSVNYTAAQSGNGVYFLNCCVNGNNAYYKFTGSTIGNIFNTSQGQITFYLKSRYSFVQRAANAATSRYAFDVRDGNGTHLFYFLTQVSGGLLFFNYGIAGTAQYTYVQAGKEDATFGNGVILQVQMTWSAGITNLYLNGVLVKSAPSATTAANWSASSVFDLGAYEYQTYGGFYGSDDAIDGFTVSGPAAGPDTTSPVVKMTAPANGATVSGAVTLTATATDNVAVTGVQFQLDGATLAGTPAVAGSTYTFSWNSRTAANGTHTLAAIASDAAGNTATS
ncbi:MAG: TIGR03790 family protein, partial [Bryobacteraceae bacterium]